MKFTKMQGAGNDFILIDNMDGTVPEGELGALAKRLCARRLSVGADGLMAVVPAKDGGDYGMLFYNADGSLGEMCGNGARCIARYGYEHSLAGTVQHIETTAGLVVGQRVSETLYRVRLNDPSVVDLHRTAHCKRGRLDTAYLELGQPGIPHAVLWAEWDCDRSELFALGRELRYSESYPKGANVTFVRRQGPDSLRALTYERGVEDFTLACGTGCGSAVAAMTLMGQVSGKNVAVTTDGGELTVDVTVCGDTVKDIYLTGPTVLVCQGEIMEG